MKIIYSPKSLEYSQVGHPESPERVRSSYDYLKDKFEIIEPDSVDENVVLLAHTKDHFQRVKTGQFFDYDTPNYSNIFEIAIESVSAAVTAMNLALTGEACFSLMRPPGHHASADKLEGFCYFNNIAIAVMKAFEKVDKVAIIDFDCHHGNGTQNIFLGNEKVKYLSLHQSPLYPGTGLKSEDNCINYPLPAGTGEDDFLNAFSEGLNRVADFKPDLIAVSAGFDSFTEDPITGMCLELTTFKKIGQSIKALDLPTFSVLEGGYSDKLKECIEQYLIGLE